MAKHGCGHIARILGNMSSNVGAAHKLRLAYRFPQQVSGAIAGLVGKQEAGQSRINPGGDALDQRDCSIEPALGALAIPKLLHFTVRMDDIKSFSVEMRDPSADTKPIGGVGDRKGFCFILIPQLGRAACNHAKTRGAALE